MIDVQEVKVPEFYQQQKNLRYFHNNQILHKSGQVFSDSFSQSYITVKVCLLSVNPKFN